MKLEAKKEFKRMVNFTVSNSNLWDPKMWLLKNGKHDYCRAVITTLDY